MLRVNREILSNNPPSVPSLQPAAAMLPIPISPPLSSTPSMRISNIQPIEIAPFNSEMQESIQSLINEYQLGSHLCLLDLFGLKIFHQLKDHPKERMEVLAVLRSFYTTLLRQSPLYEPLSGNCEIGKDGLYFFRTKDEMIACLQSIIETCRTTPQSRSQVQVSAKALAKLKEIKEKEFKKSIDSIFLFIEFLKRPDLGKTLLQMTINNWQELGIFRCSDQISQTDIENYLHYIDALHPLGTLQREAGFTRSIFGEVISQIKKICFTNPDSLSGFYDRMQNILSRDVTPHNPFNFQTLEQHLINIQNGTLTIGLWNINYPYLPISCTTSQGLKERLLSQYFMEALIHAFSQDIVILIERIGEQKISGYIPRTRLIKDITSDLQTLPTDAIVSTSSETDIFRLTIREVLKIYFRPLEESFKAIVATKADWRGSSLGTLTTSFKEAIDQFEAFIIAQPNPLDQIPEKLLALHRDHPEEIREKEELERFGFEELQVYLPLLTTLERLSLLRDPHKRPQDLFQIFGNYINALELPKIEQPPLSPSPSSLSSKELSPILPLPLSSEAPAVLPILKTPPTTDTLPQTQASKPKKTKKIVEIRNKTWQDLWNELRTQGFSVLRQAGSHRILSLDGKSAHIVLPIHNQTLKLGTVSNIYAQRDAALQHAQKTTQAIASTSLTLSKKK